MVSHRKLPEHGTAKGAQVPGEDEIIVINGSTRVLQMLHNGIAGCRGHGRPHIVGILDAFINNLARGNTGNSGPLSILAQNDGSRTGDGPLGRGRPLAAIFQRESELAFSRAEMAGCSAGHIIGRSAVNKYGTNEHGFAHGGAGPKQSQIRGIGIPEGVAGRCTLVQEIPGEDYINILCGLSALLQGFDKGIPHEPGFGRLKGLLPGILIVHHFIEILGQGAIPFFSSHNGRTCQHNGLLIQNNGLLSQPFCHYITCFQMK